MIKRILAIAAIFAVLVLCMYGSALLAKIELDEKLRNEARKIVCALRPIIAQSGGLPRDLPGFLKKRGLKTKVCFGPFSREIQISEIDGDVVVEYYNFPLGPFEGYSFVAQEWYAAE